MTYEEREKHPHQFVRNLSGSRYCEERTVNRGRTSKKCIGCSSTIHKGEPAWHYKFWDDDGYWPENIVCCDCLHDHIVLDLISQMKSGKFDV